MVPAIFIAILLKNIPSESFSAEVVRPLPLAYLNGAVQLDCSVVRVIVVGW